jgi:hypothetical protein
MQGINYSKIDWVDVFKIIRDCFDMMVFAVSCVMVAIPGAFVCGFDI